MAEETRSVKLAIDNSKALKALEELRKKELDIAKAQAKGTITANEAAKAISKVEKERRDLIKVNRVLDNSFGKTTNAIKEETRAVSALDQRLKDLDETSSKQRQQIGIAGDVGSAGRTLGGAVGAFGGETGGQIESAISALSELPDSLEAIGQLKPALAGLPDVATKVADSVGLGGLSGQIQTLAPALGSAGAATVALAIPLVAVAGTIAVVTLALGKLAEQSERTREAVRTQFDAQTEVQDLLRDSNTTSVDFLEARAAAEQEMIKALDIVARAEQDLSDVRNDTSIPFRQRLDTERELQDIIEEGKANVSEATLRLGEYNEHVFDSSLATANAAVAEEELASERAANVAQLQSQLGATEQRANQAIQSELAIGQQIVDAYSDRTQAQADAADFAALEAEFAAEDLEAKETKHRDTLAKIASDGQAKLEGLQAKFGELANDRSKALVDVDKKGNDKLGKLRGDFFGNQIKATQNFLRETVKIESKRSKEIARITEDTLASQRKAQQSNDVSAFLEAQESGNIALKRSSEDAQDAEKQRVAEFTRQREEERQVFEAKQAETLAAIQSEKAAVIQAFNERRAALAEQVQAEKLAIEERLQAEEQSDAKQELRDKLAADRQAKRDEIRQQHEQRDFDASIANLRNQAQLKQQIYQEEIAALQAIQQQIASLQSAASQPVASGGSRQASLPTASSRFGQRRPNSRQFQAFHEGGVIDFGGGQSEGFALVKKGELVINPDSIAQKGGNGLPLASNSGGASAGLGRSINVTVQDNRTVQIGDIASVAAVEQAIRTSSDAIVTSFYNVIEKAVV